MRGLATLPALQLHVMGTPRRLDPMASKPTLETLRTALRETGLRATSSRLAVLQHLRTNVTPISHAEIVDKLSPGPWDPATIYRNLIDLVEVGLVRRTDVGDHVWRFEAVSNSHDAQGHPHFVCTECGTIECMPEMQLVAPRTKTPRAVKQHKIEVQLRGLCDSCI